jgi:rubrerythrin
MSIVSTLQTGWQKLRGAQQPDERQQLVQMLRDAYLEEARDVIQFTNHAKRMYYPQFRERLLRLAGEEQAHVQWLQEQISTLGGELPQSSFTPHMGKNSWACLRMDVEAEKQGCQDLLRRIYVAERVAPEIAEGLRRMRTDEKRHRDDLLDMMMKSEPDALPQDPPS